jgi:hypothetical protein
LIDGGAISAISDLPGYYVYRQGTITNSGIIRSSGSAATIFQYRNFNPGNYVENAGLIENLGSGRHRRQHDLLSRQWRERHHSRRIGRGDYGAVLSVHQ